MELVGCGWGREKQMGVWENFNALRIDTQGSLQPPTPSRATFKGLETYLTLAVWTFVPPAFLLSGTGKI